MRAVALLSEFRAETAEIETGNFLRGFMRDSFECATCVWCRTAPQKICTTYPMKNGTTKYHPWSRHHNMITFDKCRFSIHDPELNCHTVERIKAISRLIRQATSTQTNRSASGCIYVETYTRDACWEIVCATQTSNVSIAMRSLINATWAPHRYRVDPESCTSSQIASHWLKMIEKTMTRLHMIQQYEFNNSSVIHCLKMKIIYNYIQLLVLECIIQRYIL